MTHPGELEGEPQVGGGFAPRPVGALLIGGGEARDFLQRMLTQEVRDLGPGTGRRACLTDRMAKIIGSMELLSTGEGFLALTDPACLPDLAKKLRMYVLGAPVEIEDRSQEFLVQELVDADELLGAAGVELPPREDWSHRETTLEGHPIRLVRSPRLGPGGLMLLAGTGAGESLGAALSSLGLAPLSETHTRALRVLAGTPVHGIDYDGESMPPEVGLGDAVSYRKGCYVGQEILERLRSRGKVTRLLRLVELPGTRVPESPPTITLGDDPLGTLTSLTPSPRGELLVGLASLPARKVVPGDTVQVAGQDALIKEFD